MSNSPLLSQQRHTRFRFRHVLLTGVGGVGLMSAAARADCTADSAGLAVTCTGASTGYSNVTTGVALTADTTAAVTGPILLGNSASVTNGGSLTGTANTPVVQLGTYGTVVNNGTISLANSSSGSAAISVGDYGSVTNNGSLSASAGTPVLQFGQAGTFVNASGATAAVTGNILYGPNISGGTSSFSNANLTYGYSGNIYSSGNSSIDNSGLFSGSIIQTATGGTVNISNDSGGTFAGSISTGDTTALVNAGTMSLTSANTLGGARFGTSSFTNNGTLNVGTTYPTELVVNGGFVNGANGVLNIALHSSGATAPVAGSTYSQIYAAGPSGTATLGGTLNIVPTPGFYQSGSTYNIILADQGISGNFATVTGSGLPFISFVPVGVTTIGSQQAFEVQAVRLQSYAQALAPVGTANELSIARGLDPVIAAADLDPTSAAAGLVGQIDLLTLPQAQTLLDQINPAQYLAFGQALTDQVNLFSRQVMLRTNDQNSTHPEAGIWFQASGQRQFGSSAADASKTQIFGITGGYDLSGPRYVIGAALGFSSASLHNGSAAFAGHNNAYTIGAYGAYHLGPLVVTGQLDYDLGNITATKTLDLGYSTTTIAATTTTPATSTVAAVPTTITGSSRDHMLKAIATIGVEVTARNFKITPFAGIDYSVGAINGFTEAGANAGDLTVGRIATDRTDLLAGINATTATGQFRPYVRAAYRSELGTGSNSSVSAFFNADPTAGFTVTGADVGRHELDVDAGVNVVYDDEGGFFVGYQGTLRSGASDHGLQAGLRLQF